MNNANGKAVPYCNCKKANEVHFKKPVFVKINTSVRFNVFESVPTKLGKDETCAYCGYYAFFIRPEQEKITIAG